MLRFSQIVVLLTSLMSACPPLTASGREVPKKQTEIWIGDVLGSAESIRYKSYVLEKRTREVELDLGTETALSIDVSYAVLKRNRRVLARFDGDIYFGAGNAVRFGLVSILGGPTKQAVISQDIFRGGAQWIVNLAGKPRIIFNGMHWSVGREGDDMTIVDLDGDGVFEVIVPITDFYSLQDKMSMSQIPLPEIVFRYDLKRKKYLPANPRFRNYLFGEIRKLDSRNTIKDEFAIRSAVLHMVLTHIYAGRRKEGWQIYNRTYRLDDRVELKRRIKSTLRQQPVYNFIYRRARRK
ncbi:MAG TPA: hypothetical protein VFX97_11320 [Pyrinomonadaceae bacterium]|nr:hypothetical protein [Pyrinomonadaceae bacterium]